MASEDCRPDMCFPNWVQEGVPCKSEGVNPLYLSSRKVSVDLCVSFFISSQLLYCFPAYFPVYQLVSLFFKEKVPTHSHILSPLQNNLVHCLKFIIMMTFFLILRDCKLMQICQLVHIGALVFLAHLDPTELYQLFCLDKMKSNSDFRLLVPLLLMTVKGLEIF